MTVRVSENVIYRLILAAASANLKDNL